MVIRSNKKKQLTKAEKIYLLIALIAFNLFFLLQFLIGWIGMLIGFIFASFVMIVSGALSFVISAAASFAPKAWISQYVAAGIISPTAVAFLSIALVCLGLLWMIGNYYLAKYSYKVSMWYIKLNVKLFKKYGN
ncbi:MAG: DUF1700 domain-containing protein [Nanoarchaeota archaeon]|nr:DUF1700 domain-containing protein [Nanoarchaeota archaeon]